MGRILILGVMLFWGANSSAFRSAYIEDNKVKSIQAQFEFAAAPTEAQITGKENWSCSVYGMKSRIYVKKKDSLYVFRRPSSADPEIRNNGSQPISKYEFVKEGLSGKRGNLLDVVRITSAKSLISEISIPSSGVVPSSPSPLVPGDIKSLAKSGRTVIAYAICE